MTGLILSSQSAKRVRRFSPTPLLFLSHLSDHVPLKVPFISGTSSQSVYCSCPSMVTICRDCHLRIPLSVPSALNVSCSNARCLSPIRSMCHVPTMNGVYCSRSCSVFSCAYASAHSGSSLPQEVREKAASITNAILQSFIVFISILFVDNVSI